MPVTQRSLKAAYLGLSLRLPIEDIKVRQRLDRGYGIVISEGYSIAQGTDNCYTVYRASTSLLEDNSVTYEVGEESCTCPDFPTARGGLCKHRLAVMLVEEMKKDV